MFRETAGVVVLVSRGAPPDTGKDTIWETPLMVWRTALIGNRTYIEKLAFLTRSSERAGAVD